MYYQSHFSIQSPYYFALILSITCQLNSMHYQLSNRLASKRPHAISIDKLNAIQGENLVYSQISVCHLIKNALYNNKHSLLKKLLNADNVNMKLTQDAQAQEGETLLHYACRIKRYGHLVEYPDKQTICILLDKGAGYQAADVKKNVGQQLLF